MLPDGNGKGMVARGLISLCSFLSPIFFKRSKNRQSYIFVIYTALFYRLENTLLTLFWSLFGLTNKKDIKLNLSVPFVTETIGEMLFIVYHAMAIIVLINMLIAMMSNSFLTIEVSQKANWGGAHIRVR